MKRVTTHGKKTRSAAKHLKPRMHATKKAFGKGKRSHTHALVRPPAGFQISSGPSRLLVPDSAARPVPPGKLRRGITEAKEQLDGAIDELLRGVAGAYEIKEIKVVASFSADGKFMGFGVGGAASIELTICPCDDD